MYWSPTSEWHRGGDNFHYSVTWYVESDSGPPRLAASPDWERVSGNRAFFDVEAEQGVCSCIFANQVSYFLGPSTALQSAETLLYHNSGGFANFETVKEPEASRLLHSSAMREVFRMKIPFNVRNFSF